MEVGFAYQKNGKGKLIALVLRKRKLISSLFTIFIVNSLSCSFSSLMSFIVNSLSCSGRVKMKVLFAAFWISIFSLRRAVCSISKLFSFFVRRTWRLINEMNNFLMPIWGFFFLAEVWFPKWLFSCHWLIEGEYDDCLERFLTDNGKVVLHMSERIIE